MYRDANVDLQNKYTAIEYLASNLTLDTSTEN